MSVTSAFAATRRVSLKRIGFSLTGLSVLLLAPRAGAVAVYPMLTTVANVRYNWAYVTPDPTPSRIYMVMPNGTPNGVNAINNNRPIGVWYDNFGHNWGIFNQDVTAMPVGTGFNVWTLAAASNVYTHRATTANIRDSYTYLDNIWLNGNPNALVWVTQNWNPGGASGVYNPHHVGVWYDYRVARWAIFNEDLTAMTPGASFNIVAESGAQYPHYFVLRSSPAYYTPRIYINSVWSNGYLPAGIFVTPVYNPGGTTYGVYNNHALIVRYDSTQRQWYIVNQDGTFFAPNAAFNVWVVSHA